MATVTPVLPLPGGPHATDVYQATGPLLGTTTRGLASGTWLHLPNHLGSNTVVVDTSGLPVARYVYEPFGRLSKDHSWGYDVTTRQYTGQEMDAETGLYDYGARHYDPKLAEFLVPDEVILGNGLNPQGYNLTAYVLNQPLRFIDPTGRYPLEGVETFLNETADDLLATGGAVFHFAGGFVDGIAPIPLNTQPDPNYELAFAGGQIVGGLVGIVVDAWLMANGASLGVGGGAVCGTGVGCLVGAPAAGAGAAMAVGGMAAATTNHIPSIGEGANKLIHQMSSVGDGGGASRGVGKLNPLDGTRYTDKVRAQMRPNLKTGRPDNHGFPLEVDNSAGLGRQSKITGGDGVVRTKIELDGNYQGKNGVFEWIIEPDGTVNHRLFRPGGSP